MEMTDNKTNRRFWTAKRALMLTAGFLLAVSPTVAAWNAKDATASAAAPANTFGAMSDEQDSTLTDADTGDALPPTPATRPAEDEAVITQGLDSDGTLKLSLNKSRLLITAHRLRSAESDSAAVTAGSADVATALPISPRSILVTGKKTGTTNLIIEDELGHRQVVEVTVSVDLGMLNAQLKSLSSDASIVAADSDGMVVLRGHVPNLKIADEAAQLAAPYGVKVLNFLEVAGGQQVLLEVKFAEVNRTVESELGVNFAYSDGRSIGGMNTGGIGNISSSGSALVAGSGAANIFGEGVVGRTVFDYFVQALRQNNLLRVLAEPNLVTMSGEQASFLAGGQIPIPVPQPGASGTTITIQYQSYGVKLNFIPVVLGNGRIRLKVAPEVSDLDHANGVQLDGFNIPAFTTQNLQTVVELGEGQTFCLAGLLNNKVTATTNVTPGLGDLPVLGALFRSVQYQRSETELVVMVTPHLVEAMNPDQVTPVAGEHWRYPSEADMFLYRDLGGEIPDNGHASATQPVSTGPAPRFRGQYGFAPTSSTDVVQH
jgi:pilus assembly protein CpaC